MHDEVDDYVGVGVLRDAHGQEVGRVSYHLQLPVRRGSRRGFGRLESLGAMIDWTVGARCLLDLDTGETVALTVSDGTGAVSIDL